MRVLAGPSYQNRVPMMAPEPPVDFVQRPVEFEALKRKLLDAKGDAVAITAALRGAGGYGKTTLAKALAHDPDIAGRLFRRHPLGRAWRKARKPALHHLGPDNEILTGERPGLETLNCRRLQARRGAGRPAHPSRHRRRLARAGSAPLPARRAQHHAAHHHAPRRHSACESRAPAGGRHGGERGAGASLLGPAEGSGGAAERRRLRRWRQRLGEWAQLLKLVNGFLRDRVERTMSRLPQAIAGVNKRLDIKGLTAFDARNEADRANAIAKTIGVSLDLLDEDERARFAELAVFPEDVDVPLGVVARLWRETGGLDEVDTEDLLRRLQSLSLLLSLDLDRRTFRFHDTVRHFLQEQAGKDALAALHKRLLEALDGIDADAGADEASRRYYFLHRPAHLAAAGERAALDALLLDPGWLQAKLDALGSPQALSPITTSSGKAKCRI